MLSLTRVGAHDGGRDLERAVGELRDRLPAPLAPLADIVFNYRWAWLCGGAMLFSEMDPALWRRSGCNPRWMAEAAAPRRLRELANDGAYVKRVEETAARIDADLRRPPAADVVDPARPVAYVCSEFGAHCSLPLYGGGLGILAGDVLKTASDLALPLVGVGLLYRQGYFHQRLDDGGWQREYWTSTDYERLPAVRVSGSDDRPLRIRLPLWDRDVSVQVWRIDFGRVPLFLLDTDVAENLPIDRWITARLYIGDRRMRLAQYALLGPGAVRVIEAMGVEVGLYHLNEGHGALGVFERVARRVRSGATPEAALEAVRAETLFTTHTPIAVGNEWYGRHEVDPVLGRLREALGLSAELFYGLGSFDVGRTDQPVAITPLALRSSRAANAVSRRHGEVARAMWKGIWPGRPAAQIPIQHVTNGVHADSWMAEPMQALLDRYLGPRWREAQCDAATWEAIAAIPDEELWETRRLLRLRLVQHARERSVFDRLDRDEPPEYVDAAARVFDPDHLTIGFARRVATYKRLHLLTRRLDTGLRLLADERCPMQMVIAGKAHPQDQEAKESLRALLAARHAPHVGERIVFLEDYDLHQAPRVTAGVDLWLNLPRPPLEASGTSGMKVAMNGGLNLSVLDGWWEEAYEPDLGWAIATPPGDPGAQDEHDADALFGLLEREIIPLFYERDADGIPRRWLASVKRSMARLIPRFSTRRMLGEYVHKLYRTA
jgi:starch phosphorylase